MSGENTISGFNQVLGVVAIDRFQSIIMANNDNVAIGGEWFRHPDNTIESRHDRIVGTSLDIYSGMMSSSSPVRRDHVSIRKGKCVFPGGD